MCTLIYRNSLLHLSFSDGRCTFENCFCCCIYKEKNCVILGDNMTALIHPECSYPRCIWHCGLLSHPHFSMARYPRTCKHQSSEDSVQSSPTFVISSISSPTTNSSPIRSSRKKTVLYLLPQMWWLACWQRVIVSSGCCSQWHCGQLPLFTLSELPTVLIVALHCFEVQ